MIWTVLHWLTLASMWWVIVRGWKDARHARWAREQEELWKQTRARLVKSTGLTALQVQVALDEGNAAFNRRLQELQRHKESNA